MIDREHEQLMQEVLDGTASPPEVERLEVWLAGNELGRTRMRELEGIFLTLGRIPAAEAPAGLREGVLNVLQPRAAVGKTLHPRPHLRSWFGSRARVGFAFAAGLAAGAVVVGVFTGIIPPVAPGSGPGVSGTMMPAPASPSRVERTLAVPAARVQAMAWRTNDGRRVSLVLQGSGPAEIELSFDASRLSVRTLYQAHPAGVVESRPGRVLVHGQGGEFSLDFSAVDASAPIQVELRSAGGSAAVELPAPGGDATH
jgi:hypothetical protein